MTTFKTIELYCYKFDVCECNSKTFDFCHKY